MAAVRIPVHIVRRRGRKVRRPFYRRVHPAHLIIMALLITAYYLPLHWAAFVGSIGNILWLLDE